MTLLPIPKGFTLSGMFCNGDHIDIKPQNLQSRMYSESLMCLKKEGCITQPHGEQFAPLSINYIE